VSWEFRGRAIRLVDTAGMRRRARVDDRVEGLAGADARRAIRFAHVAVLVLDATQPLEKLDLTIARMIAEEGRAPVIALNKWDLVNDRKPVLDAVADRIETSLAQVRGVRVVALSALTGQGLRQLLPTVLHVDEVWNRRIGTGPLNRWLAEMEQRHPPPLVQGRRIRLRYATQAKARPPTFVVFASRPKGLPESYLRYLINGLRDAFDLDGVPVRILVRKGKNPYAAD